MGPHLDPGEEPVQYELHIQTGSSYYAGTQWACSHAYRSSCITAAAIGSNGTPKINVKLNIINLTILGRFHMFNIYHAEPSEGSGENRTNRILVRFEPPDLND